MLWILFVNFFLCETIAHNFFPFLKRREKSKNWFLLFLITFMCCYFSSLLLDAVLGQLSFSPTTEGTSVVQASGGSTSSRSDSSDEQMTKSHLSSHCNLSSPRCFLSKPIHPQSFPSETPTRETADATATGISVFDVATPHRDTLFEQC